MLVVRAVVPPNGGVDGEGPDSTPCVDRSRAACAGRRRASRGPDRDAGARTRGDQGWVLWILRRPPGAARGDARYLGTRGNRERDRPGGERRRERGRPQQAAATLRG